MDLASSSAWVGTGADVGVGAGVEDGEQSTAKSGAC